MSFRFKMLLAVLACLTAVGCASPQATELEKPLGDPYIFVFSDEKTPFSIAYHAMSREVDSSLIKELNGPVKGFYARKESWGGNTNYWVRIFAANGANRDGRNTYGYYGEVMVEGDKGTERQSARNIFGDMEAMFAQQGQKVYVRNLARAKYRGDEIGDYRGGAYNFDSVPRRADPQPEGQMAQPQGQPGLDRSIQRSPGAASAPQRSPVPQDAPLADPARGEYVPPARQAAPAAPAVGVSGSMADEILKLDELRKKGILSNEEFQKAKERILGL